MKHKLSANKGIYTLLPPLRRLPDTMTLCPKCGGEVELWSEAEEVRCFFCGHRFFERGSTIH